MSMAHWPFILAAYSLTIMGVGALLLWCWMAMRRAERALDALQEETL